MTITYHSSPFGDFEVPILIKVNYGEITQGGVNLATLIDEQDMIDDWLKENCHHRYYHSPSWSGQRFIEFECDQDAMLFALRWS